MLTTHARATGSPAASRPALGACAAKAWISSKGARRFEPMWRSQLSQVARGDRVVLEDRGVVDQHGQRPPERRGRRRHQRRGRGPVEQVGLQRRPRGTPRPRDLGGQRLGGVAAAVVVDRHVGAARGEVDAPCAAPEPLRAAGDQRGPDLAPSSRPPANRQLGPGAGLRAGPRHIGAAGRAFARRLDRRRRRAVRAAPAAERSASTRPASDRPGGGGRRVTIMAPAARSGPRPRDPRRPRQRLR